MPQSGIHLPLSKDVSQNSHRQKHFEQLRSSTESQSELFLGRDSPSELGTREAGVLSRYDKMKIAPTHTPPPFYLKHLTYRSHGAGGQVLVIQTVAEGTLANEVVLLALNQPASLGSWPWGSGSALHSLYV